MSILFSSSRPETVIFFKLNNLLFWKLIFVMEPNKNSKKNTEIFFYFFFDASFNIHSINFKKLIPLYAAISGTSESFVIPGWVFNSKR